MDNIKIFAFQDVAGTGKQILDLECALEQKNKYAESILARPINSISNRDIGILPGNANEKIKA